MDLFKNLNLALSFFLELAMLVAYGYWGFNIGDSTVVHLLFGLGLPIIAIIIWSIYNAPRATRRLPRTPRIILEVVMFSLAAIMLALVGQMTAALFFAAAILINQILIYIWQQ